MRPLTASAYDMTREELLRALLVERYGWAPRTLNIEPEWDAA